MLQLIVVRSDCLQGLRHPLHPAIQKHRYFPAKMVKVRIPSGVLFEPDSALTMEMLRNVLGNPFHLSNEFSGLCHSTSRLSITIPLGPKRTGWDQNEPAGANIRRYVVSSFPRAQKMAGRWRHSRWKVELEDAQKFVPIPR